MQGLGSSSSCSTFGTDPEVRQARMFMSEKIYDLLLRRRRQQTQPVDERERRRIADIASRLEKELFTISHSKEEYMNLNTLEIRLLNLIKRPWSRQYSVSPNPSTVDIDSEICRTNTSITSGRSASGASDMSLTQDDSSALTNVDNRNMLQTGGSFNRSDGTQLPVLHQQNALPPHLQNSSNPHLSNNLENLQAREFMREKIHDFVQQRFPQPISEEQRRKIGDIVRLLEDGLLRTSHTKEEYMNLETLESRLHDLIRHSQPHPQLSSSTSNLVNTQDIEYLLRELALD